MSIGCVLVFVFKAMRLFKNGSPANQRFAGLPFLMLLTNYLTTNLQVLPWLS